MIKIQLKRFLISQLCILSLGVLWEIYFIVNYPESRMIVYGIIGLVVSFLGTLTFNLLYFLKTDQLFFKYVVPGVTSFFLTFILFADNRDLSFFYFLSFALLNLLLGAMWLSKPIRIADDEK